MWEILNAVIYGAAASAPIFAIAWWVARMERNRARDLATAYKAWYEEALRKCRGP